MHRILIQLQNLFLPAKLNIRDVLIEKDIFTPPLIPSNRRRLKRIKRRASIVSSEIIKARAARIASKWTYEQRSDRKLLGTVKREQLFRIINRSSND